jgi:DNA-binding NtrC family response regulator
MQSANLAGRSILIVEDEALIALEVANAFQEAGATVTTTSSLRQAIVLVEHDGLSAVILDHTLADGDSRKVRERLKARGVPFVIYTGYGAFKDADGPVIHKPAKSSVLVETIARLIDGS